jgi:hypothetical protein
MATGGLERSPSPRGNKENDDASESEETAQGRGGADGDRVRDHAVRYRLLIISAVWLLGTKLNNAFERAASHVPGGGGTP